jgi:hypothetical protein
MTFIELTGRVTEDGKLEFPEPTNLPPGAVRIIIETFDTEAEAADEALWDAQFAASQDVLEHLSQEAHEDYLAGRTEDCDDPDAL